MTPLQAVRKVGLGDTAVDLIRQIIEKHDAAIVEESAQQIAALRKECDALRAAMVHVRAHTGTLPNATLELTLGLLASIERIASAALARGEPTP